MWANKNHDFYSFIHFNFQLATQSQMFQFPSKNQNPRIQLKCQWETQLKVSFFEVLKSKIYKSIDLLTMVLQNFTRGI